MLLVELDWLQDAEFLGRIGRDALAVVLERLAPVLARQGVALPGAGLPDAIYFPKLAAVLRAQSIKLASRRQGWFGASTSQKGFMDPSEKISRPIQGES
jgi:hypothetical protein